VRRKKGIKLIFGGKKKILAGRNFLVYIKVAGELVRVIQIGKCTMSKIF